MSPEIGVWDESCEEEEETDLLITQPLSRRRLIEQYKAMVLLDLLHVELCVPIGTRRHGKYITSSMYWMEGRPHAATRFRRLLDMVKLLVLTLSGPWWPKASAD